MIVYSFRITIINLGIREAAGREARRFIRSLLLNYLGELEFQSGPHQRNNSDGSGANSPQ